MLSFIINFGCKKKTYEKIFGTIRYVMLCHSV